MKNVKKKYQQDIINFLGMLLLFVAVLKIAFYSENLFNVIKAVFGFSFLFSLPGFCIMYFWKDKFSFIARFIIGTILGTAIMGILSYYLGIIGVSIQMHAYVLSPLIAAISIALNYKHILKD